MVRFPDGEAEMEIALYVLLGIVVLFIIVRLALRYFFPNDT